VILSDEFEGGELVPDDDNLDGVLVQKDAKWELEGKSNVSLTEQDLQSLGAAIKQDAGL
jgi:hypothetical protein